MPLPKPEPGLVISYSYLWRHEHEKGQIEGEKNRPCVIILAVEENETGINVTVAPITHKNPNSNPSIEIPLKVKEYLQLDSQRSWIILNEVNQFIWPGYDLRPVHGSKSNYSYGFLPPKLFEKIKTAIIDVFFKGKEKVTLRN